MEEKLNKNPKPTNQKEKHEPTEKVKRRKTKIAVATLCTLVVLLGGLQVYASTNGYGNIFFMIRNLITTGNAAGVQELFSDKDITLSYKSIDLAEGLKIQANRLEIKDGKTKLYLSVKGQNINLVPLKYEISSKSNDGKETTTITKTIGNKPENTGSFEYKEILTLNYAVDENKTIILKISDLNSKELRTLEINLQTREITVKGEKVFEKISEIELKKYLNLFSELNDESGKENVLLYIAQSFQDNYKEFMKEEDYQYRMDKSSDRAYKNAIIKEFYGENAKFEYVNQKDSSKPKVEVLKGFTAWQYNKENDSYQPITAGEEYRHGKCIKIEDISFENDIYTVKYIYLLATGIDEDADRLEELPQYETTIKLKRDEDNLYSKYQIVSLENGNEIKDKESIKVEENENIFQDTSKLKYTSNFKDSQNGKIAILKLGENEFKTTQKDEYYIYTDMFNNSYSIKKITDITSQFEITNKDNNMALFCCTIYYIDNNNSNKTFDVAVIIPNNFEGAFVPGNYISYTGSTSFTRAFGVDKEETFENNTSETNSNINTSNTTSTNNTNGTSSSTNTSNTTNTNNTNLKDEVMNISNWKQFWPDIGMKFKLPNNFEQGKIIEKDNNLFVKLKGWIITEKFNFETQRKEGDENVPVSIGFYNEINKSTNLMDYLLTNDKDRIINSTDNRSWTDWYPLEYDNVEDSPENGYIRRSYGRVREDQIQKVIFDMKSTSGIGFEHYSFIRNVLESVSSTSR